MRCSICSMIILCIAVSCTKCPPNVSSAGKFRRNLIASELLDADPAADVCAALARGDKRFLMIADIAERVPGTEERPDVTSKYGTRFIQGTSDAAPAIVEDNAYDYADVYNRLLLRHLILRGEVSRVGPPPTRLDDSSWAGDAVHKGVHNAASSRVPAYTSFRIPEC